MNTEIKVGAEMPPHLKEQFDRMIEEGKAMRRPEVVVPAKTPAFIPPLVERVLPPTRPSAVAVNSQPPQPPTPIIIKASEPSVILEGKVIIFSGYQAFYDFLKQYPDIATNREELGGLVAVMDSIPRSCGCVRGQLNERAMNAYAQMLPIVQVKYPEVFTEIKNVTQTERIIFKEKDVVLLDV
jgi:hypothetical protein